MLKFDDEDGESTKLTVKKLCTSLRKRELTQEEINALMDTLAKKEEESQWVSKTEGPSILRQLRKEAAESGERLRDSQQLSEQLQGKLRQLREEKVAVAKDLADQREEGAREVDALRQRLEAERAENEKLSQ